MPLADFQRRLEDIAERREAENKNEEARWLMGLYVSARSLQTALYINSDPPLTPQQQKKKPDTSKILEAQRNQRKLAEEWGWSLKSVQHFGAHLGLTHIFGEPEDKPVHAEEERERAEQEAFLRRQRLIEKLRGVAAEHGNVVLFERRPK